MSAVLAQKKKLNAAMAAINKEFGVGTIKPASQVTFAHQIRIPTGIFNLDVAIGGGIPKGRIIQIVGDESVGKTTLCKRIAGNFQHTCRKCLQSFKWYTKEEVDPATGEVVDSEMVVTQPCPCGANEPHVVVYADVEGSFDPYWAALMGVDVPSLILIQPEWAEQGVDMASKLLRTGEVDLWITDSIAMMTPGAEIEKSSESQTVGVQARLINKMMRLIQSALNSLGMDNPNKPAILQVNQFREKVGVLYGDPTTWPGGHGQNYAASILLIMRAGKLIDAKGNVGGTDKVKIGKEIRFHAKKNKTFVPEKRDTFHLYFADAPDLGIKMGDINNLDQIVDYGVKVGVIEKGGAWYDLAATFGDEFKNPASNNGKFQGSDALKTFLRLNEDKARAVRERILQEVRTNTGVIPTAGDEDEEE